MSNALAKPGELANGVMAEVSRALEANKATLAALLPREITPERLKALTLTSLRKTPALLRCDPKSILSCVYEAAKLGLQPDTATADCHIIPRKGQATFQLGYKGMMKLARRAAPGIPIKAEHVCEGDNFTWEEGIDPILRHRRAEAGERGKVTHAYAIATLPSGEKVFKVIDADDIARARKTSMTRREVSPWTHHEGAMWEKTAIRRLMKTMPLDDPAAAERLYRAIDLDTALDDDRPQELGDDLPLDGEIIDAESTEREPDEWQCPACRTRDDAKHAPDCPEGA